MEQAMAAKKTAKGRISKAKKAISDRQREAARKAWITRRATTNPSESARIAAITRKAIAELLA
jgi:hypothetical protein